MNKEQKNSKRPKDSLKSKISLENALSLVKDAQVIMGMKNIDSVYIGAVKRIAEEIENRTEASFYIKEPEALCDVYAQAYDDGYVKGYIDGCNGN